MAVDQIDRVITSRRLPSSVGQVGRGVAGVARGAFALVWRIVGFALRKTETLIAAVAAVLRAVGGAAFGLVSRVAALALRIVHSTLGTLRRSLP